MDSSGSNKSSKSDMRYQSSASMSVSFPIEDNLVSPNYDSVVNQLNALNNQQIIVKRPDINLKQHIYSIQNSFNEGVLFYPQMDSCINSPQPFVYDSINSRKSQDSAENHNLRLIQRNSLKKYKAPQTSDQQIQMKQNESNDNKNQVPMQLKCQDKEQEENTPPLNENPILFDKNGCVRTQAQINQMFLKDKSSDIDLNHIDYYEISSNFFGDKINQLTFYNATFCVFITIIFLMQIYSSASRLCFQYNHPQLTFLFMAFFGIDYFVIKAHKIYTGKQLVCFTIYIVTVEIILGLSIYMRNAIHFFDLVVIFRVFLLTNFVKRFHNTLFCYFSTKLLQFVIQLIITSVLYHLLTSVIQMSQNNYEISYYNIVVDKSYFFNRNQIDDRPHIVLIFLQVILLLALLCSMIKFILKLLKLFEIYSVRLQPLKEFLIKYPMSLNQKIEMYRYLSNLQTKSNFNYQKNIQKLIPSRLFNEIKMLTYNKFLTNIPLIQNSFNQSTIMILCSKIQEQTMQKNEFLQLNTNEKQLVFLQNGTMKIHQQNQNTSTFIGLLETGQQYGTQQFFTTQDFQSQLICMNNCRIGVLKYSDFLNVIKQFPKQYEKYCMLKDCFMFSNQKQLLVNKCSICQSNDHDHQNCVQIQYRPNRYQTNNKQIISEIQERSVFTRSMNTRRSIKQLNSEFTEGVSSPIRIPYYQEVSPTSDKSYFAQAASFEQVSDRVVRNQAASPLVTCINLDKMVIPVSSIDFQSDEYNQSASLQDNLNRIQMGPSENLIDQFSNTNISSSIQRPQPSSQIVFQNFLKDIPHRMSKKNFESEKSSNILQRREEGPYVRINDFDDHPRQKVDLPHQQFRSSIDTLLPDIYLQFEKGWLYKSYFPEFNYDKCVENYNRYKGL